MARTMTLRCDLRRRSIEDEQQSTAASMNLAAAHGPAPSSDLERLIRCVLKKKEQQGVRKIRTTTVKQKGSSIGAEKMTKQKKSTSFKLFFFLLNLRQQRLRPLCPA